MSAEQNAKVVAGLEPQAVWSLFAEMAAVPRPSKHEQKIQQFMLKKAAELGFQARKDSVGNILVEVPAKPGCENAPITVLQGHLDMVGEKNSDTRHDFEHDPIQLELAEEQGEQIVRAKGTTLGADNGIGVCMSLAAAVSPDVKHGPLEILCTADEEMGMTGAKALEPSFVKGRRMLNLDSEDDTSIYIGCAGGCDSNLAFKLPVSRAGKSSETCRITVSGLRGGHSGGDIHENRGNAIKLLVQTLRSSEVVQQLQLGELTGGSKRNAIPREAAALVAGPAGTIESLTQAAELVQEEAVKLGEKKCVIDVVTAPPAAEVAGAQDTARVLSAIAALPHGVQAVVPEIAGLVQTSNSTSTVDSTVEDGVLRISIGCLSRSSKRAELHATVRQIAAVGELAGANVKSGNEYPGWAPNVDSPVLAVCRRVYQELFKEEPNVTAIHAGLECGIIGERMGEGAMDMVSFGPRIEGAHSPDERTWPGSVAKSYKYLIAVLGELAKG